MGTACFVYVQPAARSTLAQRSLHACTATPSTCHPLVIAQAVAHQLTQGGSGGEPRTSEARATNYLELRERTAAYMEAHADDFLPFLPLEAAGIGHEAAERMTPTQRIAAYCKCLRETALWGGHPEVQALARLLKTPIVVHQADSAPHIMMPDEPHGRDAADKRLQIVFHQHYYVSGEHYNSVQPLTSR